MNKPTVSVPTESRCGICGNKTSPLYQNSLGGICCDGCRAANSWPKEELKIITAESRPALQKFRTALNALYLEVEPSIANDIVDLANAAISEAEAASSSNFLRDEPALPSVPADRLESALGPYRHDLVISRKEAIDLVREVTRTQEKP